MRVTFRDNLFICVCTFDERSAPRRAGFIFDQEKKLWTTSSIGVAARLRQYFDEAAKNQTARRLINFKPWAGVVSAPKGKKPREYQIYAAHFALSRNRSYLALDPGLGKTIIAAVVSRSLDCKSVYICPPFLARNTEEEFKTWEAPEPLIVPDTMLGKAATLKRIKEHLQNARDTLLFIDEAHRFKSAKAQRTQNLFENIAPLFDRVVFLSGTPMPNGRPLELFPILSNCAPETIDFMSEFDFGLKYCGAWKTQFGWDFSGASNMPTLVKKVIGPFMLRMRKSEVLTELPPKVEAIVVLGSNEPPKLATMSREILKLMSPVDIMKHQIAAVKDKSGEELHISTYRKELGVHKVNEAAEFIEDVLDSGEEAVLVFAIHTEVIKALTEKLSHYNPFVITGETPMAKRHEQVKAFQSGASRLFIGNIQAMGLGLTLTKATRAVFVEYSWVDADNQQASDRMHRIGQRDSVLAQYLVYANSIDKAVLETVLRKRQISSYV